MGLAANIKRDFVFMKRLLRILKWVKPVNPDSHDLVCDDFEAVATKWPNNLAVKFEGKSLTYQQLEPWPTATPTGAASAASRPAIRWRCSCPTGWNIWPSGSA